jgi:hypothetical protein
MPDGTEQITVKVIPSISEVSEDAWNACAGTSHPFTRHAFFSALEDSGSATAETGWQPQHLIVESADGGLLGAVPLYLKTIPMVNTFLTGAGPMRLNALAATTIQSCSVRYLLRPLPEPAFLFPATLRILRPTTCAGHWAGP